jgi:hypothetical protein
MFLGSLLMLCIGIERGVQKGIGDHRTTLMWMIGGLAILIMIQRGYYWNIFDGSIAGWSLNRISALIIFTALYFLAEMSQYFDRRKKPK